jgi:hypothetical protein
MLPVSIGGLYHGKLSACATEQGGGCFAGHFFHGRAIGYHLAEAVRLLFLVRRGGHQRAASRSACPIKSREQYRGKT